MKIIWGEEATTAPEAPSLMEETAADLSMPEEWTMDGEPLSIDDIEENWSSGQGFGDS